MKQSMLMVTESLNNNNIVDLHDGNVDCVAIIEENFIVEVSVKVLIMPRQKNLKYIQAN